MKLAVTESMKKEGKKDHPRHSTSLAQRDTHSSLFVNLKKDLVGTMGFGWRRYWKKHNDLPQQHNTRGSLRHVLGTSSLVAGLMSGRGRWAPPEETSAGFEWVMKHLLRDFGHTGKLDRFIFHSNFAIKVKRLMQNRPQIVFKLNMWAERVGGGTHQWYVFINLKKNILKI